MLNDDELAVVSKLAHQQVFLEQAIAQIEEKLKNEKERLKKVQEFDLPNAMQELGISEFKLRDGTKVSIKQDVYASIPKDDGGAAFAWLRNHKFGGLIKNQIITEFGVGEDDRALEAAHLLAEAGFTPTQKETVHPMTLKAFLKEQLSAGIIEIPLATFGAFLASKSKVEIPK